MKATTQQLLAGLLIASSLHSADSLFWSGSPVVCGEDGTCAFVSERICNFPCVEIPAPSPTTSVVGVPSMASSSVPSMVPFSASGGAGRAQYTKWEFVAPSLEGKWPWGDFVPDVLTTVEVSLARNGECGVAVDGLQCQSCLYCESSFSSGDTSFVADCTNVPNGRLTGCEASKVNDFSNLGIDPLYPLVVTTATTPTPSVTVTSSTIPSVYPSSFVPSILASSDAPMPTAAPSLTAISTAPSVVVGTSTIPSIFPSILASSDAPMPTAAPTLAAISTAPSILVETSTIPSIYPSILASSDAPMPTAAPTQTTISAGPSVVTTTPTTTTPVGPSSVAPISGTPQPPANCAALDGCFLENLHTGLVTLLSPKATLSYSIGLDSENTFEYTIFCNMTAEGETNKVQFTYGDGDDHTEWKAAWYMNGNTQTWINPVEYLTNDCGAKSVTVIASVWSGECSRTDFSLTPNCS